MGYPIDIVVPWVDGDDPDWKAERNQYKPITNSDSSDARFREWDLFRYWFRGIEQYAPWVNKVHLITWGHLPKWLNTNHPKLNIVNHKDYIPSDFLPTFSSHTIELNMHRIEGLSEHFLYFNDDVYLTSKCEIEDFFVNGKPVDTAVFGVIKNDDKSNFMPYIMLNMMAIINTHFSKHDVMKNNKWKWFSPKNGKGILNNIYLSPWGVFTGFRNYHTCVPFMKKTFKTVWEKEADTLTDTCTRKFRNRSDVNQYLMRYWQLCTGEFVPHKPNSTYLTIKTGSAKAVYDALNNKKYKVACINDDPMGFDFEKEQKELKKIFENKYPNKSSFEL